MPVADILKRIVEHRRERLRRETGDSREKPVPGSVPAALPTNAFVEALASRRCGAIIAEVKMGSPSLGDLAGRVEPQRQAATYAESGATALSVVVEPDFFHGSYRLLAECKRVSGLPAIAKDFLVHPVQIDQAVEAGADAVLLIAALYERRELRAWADLARSHGLAPLVETHSRADVEKLEGRDWEVVGVNNRDLATFRVDLEHSIEHFELLPRRALKVAESGIRTRADVARLAAAGFDAFLIGETLLLADDPGARLRELAGA